MFLDVLRRRNPALHRAAIAPAPGGPAPGQRLRHRPRRGRGQCRGDRGRGRPARAEGLRHDQADGPVERLLPGGHARRHRRVGRGRHGLRPGDAPRRHGGRPSRPSRPDPARRGGRGGRVRAGLLDGVQRREGAARRRAAAHSAGGVQPACSRASRPRATPSIAATRAASTPPTWPPSPTGSTRSTAAASPASPPSRRCSSTRRTARCVPTPNLATLARAAEALAQAGRSDIEINAPGTTSTDDARGAGRGRRDARSSPATGCTARRRCMPSRTCRSCRRCVYLTEVSHLIGGKAFCFGGGFYIDPVFPRLRRQGDRRPRADRPRPRRSGASRCRRRRRSTITRMIDASPGRGAPRRRRHAWSSASAAQAFVTRAYVVGVSGIAGGEPRRRDDRERLRRAAPMADVRSARMTVAAARTLPRRSSASRTSARPSAASSRSRTSRSTSMPARSSRWSATTAPASRR